MTKGWSIFVIALVVGNLAWYCWLLLSTAKRRPGDPAPTDTSHVWDGNLTEYNKPLPKWWINLFWLTIAFAVGYLIWFPGLGAFAGTSGWTSVKEMEAKKDEEDKKLAATFAPFQGKAIDVLAQDPAAVKIGKSVFDNNCATCHGSTAQGAIGYPNLTDADWKWGATPADILQSIQKGRDGIMTPWGDILRGSGGPNAVDYVTAYVQSLSKPDAPKDFMAAQGKTLYDGVCVACHGADGKGNTTLGAPNLTDDIWLYGGSNEAIKTTIEKGRHGVMPAWEPILGDVRTRLAGAYVWSLSHKKGELGAAAPAAAAVPTTAAMPAASAEAAAPAAAPAADTIDSARDAKVYFETGSAALSAADKSALGKLAETMKASKDAKATISGFHDATGDVAKNAELAKNRAQIVRDTLMADGVEEARISMEKPMETTGGTDAREARRVEVHVR